MSDPLIIEVDLSSAFDCAFNDYRGKCRCPQSSTWGTDCPCYLGDESSDAPLDCPLRTREVIVRAKAKVTALRNEETTRGKSYLKGSDMGEPA